MFSYFRKKDQKELMKQIDKRIAHLKEYEAKFVGEMSALCNQSIDEGRIKTKIFTFGEHNIPMRISVSRVTSWEETDNVVRMQ